MTSFPVISLAVMCLISAARLTDITPRQVDKTSDYRKFATGQEGPEIIRAAPPCRLRIAGRGYLLRASSLSRCPPAARSGR